MGLNTLDTFFSTCGLVSYCILDMFVLTNEHREDPYFVQRRCNLVSPQKTILMTMRMTYQAVLFLQDPQFQGPDLAVPHHLTQHHLSHLLSNENLEDHLERRRRF
jgi:hypothetical protein